MYRAENGVTGARATDPGTRVPEDPAGLHHECRMSSRLAWEARESRCSNILID